MTIVLPLPLMLMPMLLTLTLHVPRPEARLCLECHSAELRLHN
jgi:hypothetical protein